MDFNILCVKQQYFKFPLDLWKSDCGQILTFIDHGPSKHRPYATWLYLTYLCRQSFLHLQIALHIIFADAFNT